MSSPQIENMIAVGERMAHEGKTYVRVSRLNQQSLAYRGKRGLGHKTAAGKTNRGASAVQELPPAVTVKGEVKGGATSSGSAVVETPPTAVTAAAQSGGGVLQVEHASSGRAACRGCKENIGRGKYRVGMLVWTSGRQLTVWHHPLCFVQGAVRVEKVVRGSTARCKSTPV
jgi:hypothetical protein